MSAGAVAVAVIWGAHFAAAAQTVRTRDPWLTAGRRWRAALEAATGLAFSLLLGYWAAAGFCAGTLLLLGADWWRRKGRKVAKTIGEKSRAVIAGLAERAREAVVPVPEGVRA